MYTGVKWNLFTDNHHTCNWTSFSSGKIEKLTLILYYLCRLRNLNLSKSLGYVKFLHCGIQFQLFSAPLFSFARLFDFPLSFDMYFLQNKQLIFQKKNNISVTQIHTSKHCMLGYTPDTNLKVSQ